MREQMQMQSAMRHGKAWQGKRKREFVDAAAGRCHGALVLFLEAHLTVGSIPSCGEKKKR
jgi:hypothetical protein